MSNYWTVNELFGRPPAGVSEERFIAAWVAVASMIVTADAVTPDA